MVNDYIQIDLGAVLDDALMKNDAIPCGLKR